MIAGESDIEVAAGKVIAERADHRLVIVGDQDPGLRLQTVALSIAAFGSDRPLKGKKSE